MWVTIYWHLIRNLDKWMLRENGSVVTRSKRLVWPSFFKKLSRLNSRKLQGGPCFGTLSAVAGRREYAWIWRQWWDVRPKGCQLFQVPFHQPLSSQTTWRTGFVKSIITAVLLLTQDRNHPMVNNGNALQETYFEEMEFKRLGVKARTSWSSQERGVLCETSRAAGGTILR